jgi:non-ribosomal peptide synthetase component F
VPTVIAEDLIELSWPRESAFRFLLTGADTLRRRPPQGLPFALINNYGPTECTVVATSGKIDPQPVSEGAVRASESPSIGRPIDNVSAYVVD